MMAIELLVRSMESKVFEFQKKCLGKMGVSVFEKGGQLCL